MAGTLTGQDVETGLRELGLRDGDIVLLHSALSSLGHVDGGAEALVDAFLNVLGAEGTLVVPIFGSLGMVTDVVRARPDAVRSIHPKSGVAAIGRHAEPLCRDHWKAELAHGDDTPYMRILKMGGYVCLLGVDQDRNTMLHMAEELLRLPYLRRTAEATFETPEGTVTKSWPFFPGPHRDFIGLDHLLRGSGTMRIGQIGSSVVRLIKAHDLVEIGRAAAEQDPAFALCNNPNCADCVRQRADLRRAKFARESFTLAAAAALAGRYAEEIADNCQAAGIDAVELDALGGKPIHVVSLPKLQQAVETLRDQGCSISALRMLCVPDNLDTVLEFFSGQSAVSRVLLPLTAEAAAHVERAGAHGFSVSFYSAAMSADAVSRLLTRLEDRGLEAGFTFRAAEFARIGERPFLRSYRTKLRHFIDQLDLEDMTFDGTPQRLAEGNAEIKEMVSILRCKSFAGALVLGAANRFVGTLGDAVERFEHVLDTV